MNSIRLGRLAAAITLALAAGLADDSAAEGSLVADIHDLPSAPASSWPSSPTSAAGLVFFTCDDGVHGREPWRTDGTAAGTFLLADVEPGPAGSSPAELADVGGALMFTAFNSCTGREPYRTDGSRAGTHLVADINPGTADSGAGNFARWGDIVVFGASDGLAANGPWRTDGTPAGTRRLADAAPGLAPVHPFNLVVAGSRLFFIAAAAGTTTALWTIDDDTSPPRLVIAPEGAGTGVKAIAAFGDRVMLIHDDGVTGAEPWISDGTREGTRPLVDAYPAATDVPLRLLGSAGSRFVLAGTTAWVTDGSSEGTGPLRTSPGDVAPAWRSSIGLAGTTRFLLGDASSSGDTRELWTTDGTPEGTRLRATIDTPRLRGGALIGDRCLLHDNSQGLWLVDDEGAHVVLPRSFGSEGTSFSGIAAASDRWVLIPPSSWPGGIEPWSSDGTPAGTAMIADLNPRRPTANASPAGLAVLRDGVILASYSPSLPFPKAHVSDGTAEGTNRLSADASLAGDPPDIASSGVRACFAAGSGTAGTELWCTDGTPAGTRMVKDIWPGWQGSAPYELSAIGDRFVFFASDGAASGQPWVTDTTEAGTQRLATLPPDYQHSWLAGNARAGDNLYFVAYMESLYGLGDEEIWRTDGTPGQTTRVATFPRRFGAYANIIGLEALGSRLVFLADDGVHGLEPWRLDLLTGATSLIKDCVPGAEGLWLGPLPMSAGSLAYFAAWFGPTEEVWVTDGTEAGTRRLAQIAQPGGSAVARAFTLAGGTVYFLVADSSASNSWDLWRSDGTPEGTRMVVPDLTDDEKLWPAGDRLFFTRSSAVGREPWITDGTIEGTGLVEDVNQGGASSDPGEFTDAGSRIFFVATDGAAGRELHAWPRSVLWDADRDGVPDNADDCRFAFDPGQEDLDGDGIADACDDCDVVPDPAQHDGDCDGTADACEFTWGDVVPRGAEDGVNDIRDVVWILRASVGLEILGPGEMLRCDLAPAITIGAGVPAVMRPVPSSSKRVDVADVVLALRAAVGLIEMEAPR